jgi:hypothetical protein
MRSVVMLAMLASALVRARGSALDEAARRLPGLSGFQDDGAEPTASLSPLEPATGIPGATGSEVSTSGDDEEEIFLPTDDATPMPEPGDWQVACLLKSGSSMVFDRGSLRALGAATLVRWAAPTDARTEGQIYTALVDCHGKTIEAAWPGKQSDTRAGTCGRRLVDAVCELLPKSSSPSRALSPRPASNRATRATPER